MVRARWSLDDLDPEEREALYLIHLAHLYPRIDYLTALWPGRPWSCIADQFVESGLLGWDGPRLITDVHVAECLDQDAEALRRSHAQWIECLTPLAGYWDLSLELCLHLIDTQRYPELVAIIHDQSFAVEEAWVRDLFVQMLDFLANKPTVWRQLTPHERVLVLDALGVNRYRSGDTDAAFKLFNRMGSIATRSRDNWGIAESWLHRGLTWYACHNFEQAARCYQRAAEQALTAGHEILRGRALHNWAQCVMVEDPVLASTLLEESAECKRRGGDTEGLFAAYDAQGLLAIQRGDFPSGLRWFRRAVKLARRLGWRGNLAHGLHNLASTLCDLKRHGEAREFGEEAYALAHELKDGQLMLLTTQGLAVRCYQADENDRASRLFEELAELKRDRSDYGGAVLALSDAGAMRLRLDDFSGARERLDQAIELARGKKASGWLPQVFGNYAATYKTSGLTEAGLDWLEHAVQEAAQRGEWLVLARLAIIEAQWRDDCGEDSETVHKSWDRAVVATANANDWPLQLETMQQRYAWIRDRLGPEAALPMVKELASLLARRRLYRKEYAAVLNEMGNGLQEMERFGEAQRAYQRALKVLEEIDAPDVRADVLNNLGELWRKTRQFAQAITCYQQALDHVADNDLEERLSTEHNLALAEADSGNVQAASNRLERIRDRAKKWKLWWHHAEAWLTLGDLAWENGLHRLAIQRYGKAVLHAARHELHDLRLHAELNRAYLLLEQDKPTEVVANLNPLRELFGGSSYHIELYLALAEGFSCSHQAHIAVRMLRQALADAAMTNLQRAEIQHALARALIKSGDRREAWEQMSEALAIPCPAEQRLKFLLGAAELAATLKQDSNNNDNTKYLQAVIELAEAESTWDLEQRRRFWRDLSNTLWRQGRRGEASIASIKGMIEGVQAEDWTAYVTDGIHLFHRLQELGERWTDRETVQSWLNSVGLSNPASVTKLIWPFTLAERIGGKEIESGEIQSLIFEIWQQDHSAG